MKTNFKLVLMSSCLFATAMSNAATAAAQEAEAEAEAVQETVIVTGTRGKPRSVSDSPVPIDVIGEDELTAVPFTDANDILKTLVPSYTLSRQPISDGGTFIRPAQLRGMPTDKTLVLVNSKRRHRAALVQIGGSGTQGPDIATIPAIALQNVEVLRDGAAAQYGSDAIAGVINFILKEDAEGGSMIVDLGQQYEGDGFSRTFAGNVGLPIGDAGFVNISAEYSKADATSRSEQYCEGWVCVDSEDPRFLQGLDTSVVGYSEETYIAGLADANIGFGDVVQPWGQPNSEAVRGFVNAGYDISDSMRVYAFGNYSHSEADGSFFYRYAGNGTIENLRLEDGSLYSPLEKFPGGFTPRFSGEVIDLSAVAGLEGEFMPGFTYDLSGRFGENKIKYTLENTINPSMGPDSPTSFRPGDLINTEVQFQADFGKDFDIGLASPMLIGFGLSYLDETYELVGGDAASYEAGPFALPDPFGFCDAGVPSAAGAAVIANGSSLDCSDSNGDEKFNADDDPVYQVVGVGSNGFPGYSPEFSGEYNRDSFAAYVDVSADITDALFVQGAVRFEDYSDFDSEVVGKVAAIYKFTDSFAVRSSFGTGFRAPTPGQQGTTNVSTRLPNGFPVATGLFPAGGTIAGALGAEPLGPEKSTNYTLGFTANFGDIGITLDYYRIDLEDRVNAISTQDVSATDPGDPPERASFDDEAAFQSALSSYESALAAYNNFLAIQGAGVAGAESIGGVFYFTNAFDTKTEGVDLVVNYDMSWAAGDTRFIGSLNYNKTEITEDLSGLFNAEETFDFENGNPEFRGVFTVDHDFSSGLGVLLRANYYGEYSNSNGGRTVSVVQDFDPVVQFDLEASYEVNDGLTIAAGARNVFDEYPAEGQIGETCCGRIYRSDSIVDWQGGYYYLRAVANF